MFQESLSGSCCISVAQDLRGVGGLALFVLICDLFVEIIFTSSKSFIITIGSFHLLFTVARAGGGDM